MFSRGVGIIGLMLLLALSASAGLAAETDWNTQLEAFVGAIDGIPQDVSAFIGAESGATDGWDLGFDSKKPGEPFGEYIYTWFNRPSWGQGPIAVDTRAPIDEGTTKVWGTEFLDTFNVKVSQTQAGSGVEDSCAWGIELPVASAVYLTWTLGVGVGKEPPEDYVFTLKYVGGINPKPEGTAPAGTTVPTMNQTWDMRTVTDIAFPLWTKDFQPPNSGCTDFAAADTAKFKIEVFNPQAAGPTCDITFSPTNPEVDEAVSFNGNATGGTAPYTYAWDFGDGGTSTEAAPSHAYASAGTFSVGLTVTDALAQTGTCSTSVDVNAPPTCSISADPATPSTLDTVQFQSGASDSDGTIASYAWDFGDGGSSAEASPTHQFDNGTFNVSLTVTDDLGATGSCGLELVVSNVDPTCNISYEPFAPTVDDVVSFDSQANDPDGSVASVTWDFGDTNTGSGLTTDHQYAAPATYTVNVTVVDDDGGEGTCTTDIEILPTTEDDTPPIVTITSPTMVARTLSGTLSAGWLAADAVDPDTGVSKVDFYLDGKLIFTDTTGVADSFQVDTTLDTTLYGNGTHYVGATATNGDSDTTQQSMAVAFNNTIDPGIVPVIRQSVVRTELIAVPRQIRVELTVVNRGVSADNVTIENFIFVGSHRDPISGELIYANLGAHPTSGGDWPRNLGTLAPNVPVVLELLSDVIPAEMTHVSRWMDYGTCTKTGEPTPVYSF